MHMHDSFPLRIGPDESFELAKAFLCYQRNDLAPFIWNDQPWLYTEFLVLLFHICKGDIVWVRVLAAATNFMVVMLIGIVFFQNKKLIKTFCFIIILYSLPSNARILLSPALEAPAFTIAYLGAVYLFMRVRRVWIVYICSGCLLGLAMHLKLTSILVIPGIFFHLLVDAMLQKNIDGNEAKTTLYGCSGRGILLVRNVGLWLSGFILLYCIGIIASPVWNISLLLKNHFELNLASSVRMPSNYPFNLDQLGEVPFIIIIAIFGTIHAMQSIRSRCMFLVIQLITAMLFHVVYAPFWSYYILHFYLPISLLTVEALLIRNDDEGKYLRFRRSRIEVFVKTIIVVFVIGTAFHRINLAIREINVSTKIGNDEILQNLRSITVEEGFIYDRRRVYSYHVGLPIPPDIVVLPLKRFWTGRIDEKRIFQICKYGGWNISILITDLHREREYVFWNAWLKQQWSLYATVGDTQIWTKSE